MLEAAGDLEGADSAWARLSRLDSPWAWEAVSSRAELSIDRGSLGSADSLLGAAERASWPDDDRAEWLVLRARLAARLADTSRAVDLAAQAMRRYPYSTAAAAAVGTLDTLLLARGQAPSTAEDASAAEVEFHRRDLDRAAVRLERALGAPGADRWRTGLRLGEVLRAAHRWPDARAAVAHAFDEAPDPVARARCLLERARVWRDAGNADSAGAGFAAAARLGPDSTVRETAWWEDAQMEEGRGETRAARRAYERAADAGGRRRDEALLRAGLIWLVEGRKDLALARWKRSTSEGARFWASRALRGAGAESTLVSLARLPGYGFYTALARDTLGLRGWPGAVAGDSCAGESTCAPLELAEDLLSWDPAEAERVLVRWVEARGGPKDPPDGARTPRGLLAAARLAYAAGRPSIGIRSARLALEAARRSDPSLAWGVEPWLYPPAFDSLVRALVPDSRGPEGALIRAVAWQESKFEPRARSRSDALGLLQLKALTAGEVAGWFHEPAPGESALTDPALSLRYGTAYLGRLLARFGGSPAAALAAYNAGPSRLPPRWREYLAKGGEALLAEMIPYPETRDYVKRILGVRQAYRELDPSIAR